MTVNDSTDGKISHYDSLGTLIVTKCGYSCYYEYGTTAYAEATVGKIVAKEGGEISVLYATAATVAAKEDGGIINEAYCVGTASDYDSFSDGKSGNVDFTAETASKIQTIKEDVIYNAEAQELNAISVNGVYYKSMSDVFNKVAAKNGEGYDVSGDLTIILYKDIEDKGIIINSATDLVFDLNGHTYTANGTVGSQGTATNCFQILNNSNVTFKNGTLTSTTGKKLIQNYANLTLKNMVLDGSNLSDETISYNNGTSVIDDTTIVAKDGKYAFDISSFNSYTGANVTVKGNSVIKGEINLNIYTNTNSYSTNVSNWCIKLESGNYADSYISVDIDSNYGGNACTEEQVNDFYNNIITRTTKGENVSITAPSGYSWVNNRLTKNN